MIGLGSPAVALREAGIIAVMRFPGFNLGLLVG